MLKIDEIKELIQLIDSSSIDEFKYEQNGAKIHLKKLAGVQDKETGRLTTREIADAANRSEPPAQTNEAVEKEPEQKPVPPAETENLHKITSPMVGTFYSSPSPDAGPYIQKGDNVKTESVVCIIEAMKLMNEIEAEINGEIVDILVENGELVEYGQDLFLVKPE